MPAHILDELSQASLGQEAAWAEVEQAGVVTRADIVAPVGAVVFCADGRFPFTVRAYDRSGELLSEVIGPGPDAREIRAPLPGAASPGPRVSLTTRMVRRGEPVEHRLAAIDAVRLSGFDERYAEVPYLTERDRLAIAVIDTNGDGREVTAVLYEQQSGGGGVEVVDGISSGHDGMLVWDCGYAPAQRFVTVRYAGSQLRVVCAHSTEFEAVIDGLKRDHGVRELRSRLLLHEVPLGPSALLNTRVPG